MKYTEEEFKLTLKESYSIRELIIKLGLKPAGGNYDVAKRRIRDLNLDTSHFTQKKPKGRYNNARIPTEDLLIKDSKSGITTHKLKLRLIEEGYFERKCYECGLKEWNGHPIPIELEHKNGDRYDNRLDNLSILCPNCHALTETYRGKNKRKK